MAKSSYPVVKRPSTCRCCTFASFHYPLLPALAAPPGSGCIWKDGKEFVQSRRLWARNYTLLLTLLRRKLVCRGSLSGVGFAPGRGGDTPTRAACTLLCAQRARMDSRLCPWRAPEHSSGNDGGYLKRKPRRPPPAPGSRRGHPAVPVTCLPTAQSAPAARRLAIQTAAPPARGDRLGPQPQGRAGHGAPHRGAWAVPGHQAGEWAFRGLGRPQGRRRLGLEAERGPAPAAVSRTRSEEGGVRGFLERRTSPAGAT